jgi:hypothetical protein
MRKANVVNVDLSHIPKLSFTNLIFPFTHNYNSTFTTLALRFAL